MRQTTNGAEGSESSAPYTQAGRPDAMVTDFGDAELPPVEIDYHATGLDLGWPERVAAGRVLLEQERAA